MAHFPGPAGDGTERVGKMQDGDQGGHVGRRFPAENKDVFAINTHEAVRFALREGGEVAMQCPGAFRGVEPVKNDMLQHSFKGLSAPAGALPRPGPAMWGKLEEKHGGQHSRRGETQAVGGGGSAIHPSGELG